jgi:CcmD family protein
MDANYFVMLVVLIIWLGIFLYLYSLDRKIKRLEKRDEG